MNKHYKPVWRYYRCPRCLNYQHAYTPLLLLECGEDDCGYRIKVRLHAVTREAYESIKGRNKHDDTDEMS